MEHNPEVCETAETYMCPFDTYFQLIHFSKSQAAISIQTLQWSGMS